MAQVVQRQVRRVHHTLQTDINGLLAWLWRRWGKLIACACCQWMLCVEVNLIHNACIRKDKVQPGPGLGEDFLEDTCQRRVGRHVGLVEVDVGTQGFHNGFASLGVAADQVN